MWYTSQRDVVLYYYYHGYYGFEICRLAARRSDEFIVIPEGFGEPRL